ncbi:prenyltransferase/squalene oxidase repeat-containing protein [Streptomyces sp. PSKA30]|uniref:prenyltransferase/squalene oxidase repeat-containing protein n=1 Tax=Streptomyces sp. PSKA30 TaxID=2874597 RepID=UPI001CD09504|nr:prenyltransferase/squalene oxidase repeat-containing protein [Streptomyces sp. PSKA30]MBZ9641162.1 terpene cyclase/mutase family protein [Streptomyces sp. PSKA30]
MNVRRSAAVLAATAVIGVAATPVAQAADPSPSASPSVAIPSGLYGSTDPSFDGVWRQSLALLAQDTVGVEPAAKAVDWLTGQQCANGAFAPFRADPAKPCDAKTPVDTNMTAAAVQALAALGGHDAATGKAVTWLKSAQNKDGGWGYTAGGPSDTNSTSLVIGALTAAGEQPKDVVKSGKSPYDALLGLTVPCDEDGGGAFAYQPGKKGELAANADATAAGVLGALGKGMAARAADKASAASCADGDLTPPQAAAGGAAHLAQAIEKDGHLKSALAGSEDQPDYGNTADAVVALAAQGGAERAAKPLKWLEENGPAWAEQSGPSAYAQLIFAAHATGSDPRDFGGTDLVQRLNATGPAPQSAEKTADAAEKADSESDSDSASDDGVSVWWIIGVGLVAGIGIGFLISGRNKGQQP